MKYLGKEFSQQDNSKCKGPEMGTSLPCSRNSKEGSEVDWREVKEVAKVLVM